MKPAISVRNLSKCYKLGVINRKTLVDEARYWWSKARGRDPRELFSKVGHTATESRRRDAEKTGDDRFWALKDISFDVQPGEVIGIIGKNGAGKSTLLKILTRITEPTSGEAIINGRVGSLLEVGTGFHPELTGRENIYMNGTILGMKKREINAKFDEIVAFSELEQFIDTPVKRYSSGMYVRLAFAVAAHLEPEILLIDEVLAVGDVGFQKKCLGKMRNVAIGGRTILFVSHNMAAIQALCGSALFLDHGMILEKGSPERIVRLFISNHHQETPKSGRFDRNSKTIKESEEIKVMNVELKNVYGKVSSTFSAEESIDVEIHYRLFKPVYGMRVMLQLHRVTGEVAFTTTDHYRRQQDCSTPGNYVSICHIPENLLNLGEYIVKIWIGIPGIRYLMNPTDILRLFIAGKGNQGSIFLEKWPGVVCPQMKWDLLKKMDKKHEKSIFNS